jgi:cytochrome c6
MIKAASRMWLAALMTAPLFLAAPGAALAQEESKPAEAAPADKPKIDVRKLFATNCSWCHQDYGRKAADGPKLAGTKLTEAQVIEQITKGKTPMPGFRKILSKEQIEALAKYIKDLKDDGS